MKIEQVKAPPFSKVLKHPWLLLSTFGGSGCLRPAPGTWGSLAAWLFFIVVSGIFGRWIFWPLSIGLFYLGLKAVHFSAALLGKTDHGSVVIDEVVAVWLTMLLIPAGFFWEICGLVAFRYFDIMKLPPARGIDAGEQTAWTVMIDDIFAALYAVISVCAVAWALRVGLDLPIQWSFL